VVTGGPTAADVRARILDLARTELRLDEAPIAALGDGDLARHLDSVQRLTLVVAIEDTFAICLDPDDEGRVATLDDVVALVVERVRAR
jgi:acyl carrier protein